MNISYSLTVRHKSKKIEAVEVLIAQICQDNQDYFAHCFLSTPPLQLKRRGASFAWNKQSKHLFRGSIKIAKH